MISEYFLSQIPYIANVMNRKGRFGNLWLWSRCAGLERNEKSKQSSGIFRDVFQTFIINYTSGEEV